MIRTYQTEINLMYITKIFYMKRGRKRNPAKRNPNQLRFDFNVNVPIEIHIPKYEIKQNIKEYSWERQTVIELARS